MTTNCEFRFGFFFFLSCGTLVKTGYVARWDGYKYDEDV